MGVTPSTGSVAFKLAELVEAWVVPSSGSVAFKLAELVEAFEPLLA